MSRRLAAEGFSVFAGVRSASPASAQDGIIPVALDVTEPASIAEARAFVDRELAGRGLFTLVNNAAVLTAAPIELASAECMDVQLRTNVLGAMSLTRAFLPLLRAGPGRIVNVSSVNAQLPLPYWGVYRTTKAALVALSDALRMELAPWRIGVSVLTLGAFDTDIRRRGLDEWKAIAGPEAELYRPALETVSAVVGALDATAADPTLVADALIAVLRSDQPPARYAVGEGIENLLALAAQPVEVREAALAQLLVSPAGTAGASQA